jgi:hypothetical protein
MICQEDRLDLALPHQFYCGNCGLPNGKSLILETFCIVAIYYLSASLVKNYIRGINLFARDNNSGQSTKSNPEAITFIKLRLLQQEIS